MRVDGDTYPRDVTKRQWDTGSLKAVWVGDFQCLRRHCRSATQSWLGAVAMSLGLTQVLGPLGLGAVADGGLSGLLPRDAAQAPGAHQPLNGAASHRDAFA